MPRRRAEPRAVMRIESTDDVLAGRPDPLAELTRIERARARRFHLDAHRNDFVAAHLLVRDCAAHVLRSPAAGLNVLQSCPRCGSNEHGRPAVAGADHLRISLSHSRGSVAAAAGPETLGVDVERRGGWIVDNGPPAGTMTDAEKQLAENSEHPDETYLRLWVRKEALVKAGAIQLEDLGEIDVSVAITGARPSALDHFLADPDETTTGVARWGRWQLRDVTTPDSIGCAVTLGDRPLDLLDASS